MQDNYFKNDSIAANISLGEAKININKIKKSLQLANAWDLVKDLLMEYRKLFMIEEPDSQEVKDKN